MTTKHYGFSDAADLFVFISGYTAALVYGRTMLARGFFPAAIRLLSRAWQLYAAHVLLFVTYVASIGYIARTYEHSHLLDEFNVAQVIKNPLATLAHGLTLGFKPLNLDVLPLYIVLMAVFPPVLWVMTDGPTGPLRSRWCFTSRRDILDGISRPFRRASGTSIRLPGSCCLRWAHGPRWAARPGAGALIESNVALARFRALSRSRCLVVKRDF